MYKITGVLYYIVVIFLNAFTDLGHKIIIQNTIFKVYDGEMQVVLTAVVNALILLPFILLFSPSGFLADRYPKNKIMEYAALLAVFITLGITYSYYHGLFILSFALTFLLALQSAIYGPAKYGYIKELVGKKYISQGNAAIQATTTIAILGGIIFYSLLFETLYDETLTNEAEILQAIAPLGWLLVFGSVVEWLFAKALPNKMQERSQRLFTLKRYISGAYLRKNLKTISRKKEIVDAILALSLFWSISQVVLAIFGEYAKSNLGITNTVYVQGVMALAGIGIVFGSLLVAKYSKYYVNVGFVGIGAVGMAMIVFLIPFIDSIAIIALLFMLFGIFSGFLMVPLNARIQLLSPRVHLGTILAGNNFIQNIFMFTFLVLTTIFAYNGMNTEVLFYLMGGVGVYLSYMTLKHYFVDTFWAIMQLLGSLRHKYTYEGLENIPSDKAVLLLSNHVSWLDWILLQLPLSRPINYMMEKEIYEWPVFHAFFKKGEAIPVSKKAAKDALKEAYKRLKKGSIVGIFPEGAIETQEKIEKFHRGYELIPKDYDGVIIPVYIDGMFGSLFAKYRPVKYKKPFFSRRDVRVYYGAPLPKESKAEEVEAKIKQMKEKYARK